MKDVGHSRTLENDQTEEDVIPWDSQARARPRDQGDCLKPVVWAPFGALRKAREWTMGSHISVLLVIKPKCQWRSGVDDLTL